MPVPLLELPPGSSVTMSTTEGLTLSTISDVESVAATGVFVGLGVEGGGIGVAVEVGVGGIGVLVGAA